MPNTIVVVGFGPGISSAVAEKFGAEGFAVALVARNADRLAAGVAALKAKGVAAAAFAADAGDPAAIAAAIAQASAELGPVAALHWNAYAGVTGDLVSVDPAATVAGFQVGVVGLLAAVQAALPELKAAKGAVLVTNGAFGEIGPMTDAFAVHMQATGVALANAAKDKLVGMLSERLKGDGVYVGQVMVAGMVKGTAWDNGSPGMASIEPSAVANLFWELSQARGEIRARIS